MTASGKVGLARFSHFIWGMYHLQTLFPGMSVTSWGRSVAHNLAEGGLAHSQHLRWTAADVVWDPGTRPADERLNAAAGAMGLEVVKEPDHDHIELAPPGASQEA